MENGEFEEFELREPDNWEGVDPYQPPEYAEEAITCSSCGTSQNASNRHCEGCGARLSQQRIPVAAPPLRSVSPGARALTIILVVIAVVVVAALVIGAITGDDETAETTLATSEEAEPSTTLTTLGPAMELAPIDISCSTEYNRSLGCDKLIDGDPTTYWNDSSLRGEDALITVTFPNPVSLDTVQFVNIAEEEKFRRNYRVRSIEIIALTEDGLTRSLMVDELPDSNDIPHTVSTVTGDTRESVIAREFEIKVLNAYPSEAFGGEQGFDELAIQELIFWGREA